MRNDYMIASKDLQILDFINKITMEKSNAKYQILYFKTSKLNKKNLNETIKQSLYDAFDAVKDRVKPKTFILHNEDFMVVFDEKYHDEILSCLVKIRFILHDDEMVRNADSLEEVGLAKFWDVDTQKEELCERIKSLNMVSEKDDSSNKVVLQRNRNKIKREISPEILNKLQKILSVTDFSSFIRRQAICAIIGKSVPQRVFEEVYVSIPDLREMLLPDVDLLADPWLFMALSETLDFKVLETINRHDDGALIGNFSININVSTILSDDFLNFDDNINSTMRSSIVLELQLVDILSDIKSFILAKTFAQARGYKVCIDGITVDKLKYLNRQNLQCDLLKIIWHPSFIDVIKEDEHFMDYINKAERAKMILCRIDDPRALDVGNSLGINLYQGRYVQRLLNKSVKRTLFDK